MFQIHRRKYRQCQQDAKASSPAQESVAITPAPNDCPCRRGHSIPCAFISSTPLTEIFPFHRWHRFTALEWVHGRIKPQLRRDRRVWQREVAGNEHRKNGIQYTALTKARSPPMSAETVCATRILAPLRDFPHFLLLNFPQIRSRRSPPLYFQAETGELGGEWNGNWELGAKLTG
jgi:hypothetical protein